jgi:hypothetical protein
MRLLFGALVLHAVSSAPLVTPSINASDSRAGALSDVVHARPSNSTQALEINQTARLASATAMVSDAKEAALNRMKASVADESDCAFHDWFGACRDVEQAGDPPTFDEAVPTSPAVRLSPDCQVDWFGNWMSHQTTDWIRARLREMRGQALEAFVESQMPGAELQEQELVVRTSTGTSLHLSNIQLVDIDPMFIEHGVCWDHYEWMQQQLLPVQIYHAQSPDGLQLAITGLNAQVSFDFRVTQSIGSHTLPLGSGSASFSLRGLLMLDLNLHTVTTEAVDRCVGKFETGDMEMTHSFLSSDVILPLLARFMPSLDAKVAPLLCYGAPSPRSAAARLTPRVSFAGVDGTVEWRGLASEINEMLRQNADLLTILGWGDTPAADLLGDALEDQQRLQEVGVETELGEGRFVHVNARLPPSPPPLSFGSLAADAAGAADAAMDRIELHHGAIRDAGEEIKEAFVSGAG